MRGELHQHLDKKVMRLQRACIEVAGVAGFEPAHGDTKNRCLTTWPHPNIPAFYNLSR